ncbi:MAG: hypothetical protein ABW131_09825 [Candidatus Sedimenticola sp. 6PFRAG5]
MEEKIESYLTTDFEKKLFSASVAYLENSEDPLRINSFAYSLRELIRNIFEARAPEGKIKSCSWFKKETDNGKPSRKQRYIYCVQGGLSHKFVKEDLGMDVLEPWKQIKKTIDSLSKFTHVNDSTFDITDAECDKLSEEALGILLSIFDMVEETRSELHYELSSHIDAELMNTFISNSMPDIDILSHQSYVEHSEVTDYELVDIDNLELTFKGGGNAHVSQNYGKGDDACEINEEYPFAFTGSSSVAKPYELSIPPESIAIDTSSWFGE